jgi:hypothetical protein
MARDNVIIPQILPTISKAIDIFIEWRDKPNILLGTLSPIDLFNYTTDIDRVWFVGSSVWMPAVLGIPADSSSDIDIITETEDAYRNLFDYIKFILAERYSGQYFEEENRYGGKKLLRRDTHTNYVRKLIDVWHLPSNQTIAEHIMGFPRDHERCAAMAGISKDEVNCFTRIVKPNKENPELRKIPDTFGS